VFCDAAAAIFGALSLQAGDRAVVAALVDFLLHHLQQFRRNRQRGLFGLGDQCGVVGEGAVRR
jgi:hypothetical protein